MVDLSPTWEEIASKWADLLRNTLSWTVYAPYPENAVDSLELPAVIINEPKDLESKGFTFGSTSISYKGDLNLLVIAVDTGQARLKTGDINQITAATLRLSTAIYANRQAKGFFSHAEIGAGKLARLSPYDDDTRGHYAGMDIPYTVTMQYRS
jgi:hypothetical protein